MVNLRKRSLTLAGHSTSLALEPEFWAVLEAMAEAQDRSSAALVGDLDKGRGDCPWRRSADWRPWPGRAAERLRTIRAWRFP